MDTKNKVAIGIGKFAVGRDCEEMVAYAIGSCIALCFYDQVLGIGGMAHILLPTQHKTEKNQVSSKYADQAIPMLMEKMTDMGAKKENIVAKVIGGASMFPFGVQNNRINVGEMNISAVMDILRKMEIPVVHRDLGGTSARTVKFYLENGAIEIGVNKSLTKSNII